jgi:hypothetical protein
MQPSGFGRQSPGLEEVSYARVPVSVGLPAVISKTIFEFTSAPESLARVARP